MDVQRSMRATLLAIAILSLVTWLPHMYTCVKTVLDSLASIVSAAISPKCLFVFSNIIVVFLVTESRLSRRRNKLLGTDDNAAARDEGMIQLLTIIGDNMQEQENQLTVTVDKEEDAAVVRNNGDLQLDHCKKETDHLAVYEVDEAEGEVDREGAEHEFVLEENASGESGDEKQAGAAEKLEMNLPPADELNRRVEDFIARFNMERQLEARMLVCCY